MALIDQHFHTTLSDWGHSSKELLDTINVAQDAIFLLVATEHDIINRDFPILIKNKLPKHPQVEGVEISTTDSEDEIRKYTWRMSFHMTYYKKNISQELAELLMNTCTGKQKKLEALIIKLQNKWFTISPKDFYGYWGQQIPWKDILGYNVSHVAKYLYRFGENKRKIQEEIFNSWDIPSLGEVINECLLPSWRYARDLTPLVERYEPNLEEIIHSIEWGILSIAHPHVTFKQWWINAFLEAAELLIKKYPINAIEINARAGQNRVDATIAFCEKHQLFITFWSDFHKWGGDEAHWTFWETNKLIPEKTLHENYEQFLKQI